ncbi:MAG: uroporphyrinogen decarboxylase [Bdellovibrionales bacterium]|nr:uroporphyrinogen decarboxylase [Bdellovibrionales bacterium]
MSHNRHEDSNFISALRGKNTGKIPAWFMRQAGRYLPEYRELRKSHDFRTMSHRPDLISEVTLQPMRRYPLDAAILFSDILTCLEYMGSTFKFEENGPVLKEHGPHALQSLGTLNAEKDMAFVGEGIARINKELTDRPLIGFVGAPFTLASYLVEGGTSREFGEVRKFMFQEPEAFKKSMDHLAIQIGQYLKYQISCGVSAVQIFDSWVGFLSLDQYESLILPSMQKMIALVKEGGVPVILYSQPSAHLIPALARTGADAFSLDWRQKLSRMAAVLDSHKPGRALQGNLDPLATTLDWKQCKPHAEKILQDVMEGGLRKRFVFNVGHGVTPETKTETLGQLIDYVHSV